MKLLIFFYLAELIPDIKKVACFFNNFILLCLVLAIIFIIFCRFNEKDITEGLNTIAKKVERSLKPLVILFVVLILFKIILPSKEFIYIAGGLYTGNEIMDNPKVNALFEKSYKLIDSKLDEMLQSIGGEK